MSFGLKPVLTYQLTISGSSGAATNPVSVGVTHVRLHTDTACSVDISHAATASLTTSMRLAANFPEYFKCSGNANDTVAVIGTTGTLTVTEMSN